MSATSPSSDTSELERLPAAIPGFSDSDEAAAYCDRRGIRLCQVASDGWLVRTADHSEGAGTVLGCIEEHLDGFELMELGGGFRWSTFGTLNEAVVQLVADRRQRQDGEDDDGSVRLL